ncbi:unnamed protein product [Aphanomyces euteiches]
MNNKAQAPLELQERVSYLSADRTKADADGNYVDAKTPNDLEDGALREGGAPVYTSPEVLALLSQYFAVGLLYGSLPYVPYNVLVQYFHLTGTQYTSAKALISLGWSLKVFVGSTIGLLCALATISYIFADVPADAMVVEYVNVNLNTCVAVCKR